MPFPSAYSSSVCVESQQPELRYVCINCLLANYSPSSPLLCSLELLGAIICRLTHFTMKLVDLLYWKPVLTKGSHGETVFAKMIKCCQRNPLRTIRPNTSLPYAAQERQGWEPNYCSDTPPYALQKQCRSKDESQTIVWTHHSHPIHKPE
jgi:hypothetical protein